MKNINIKNISLDIEDIIKKDKRFLDDKGEIIKSELIEKVISLDTDLIKLLTKNHSTLSLYFTKVDTTLVFDRQKFLDFISSSEFLPKSYTAFENQIGLINENRRLLSNSREVVLNFPFKDCILEGGQDKGSDGRDEVFFNTILAPDEIDRLKEPKALVNFKKYTKDGPTTIDKIDHEKDNLILRGNNLLVLYSLLPKYKGKVKLIYIDPPYNTGSDDFKYNDRFNHSTWLVFMKNRLEVAKELLSEDGLIFVHCDNNEQAYLKILMDEIYGRDNFLETITVVNNPRGRDYGALANMHEFMCVFSKTYLYEAYKLYDEEKEFPYKDTNGEFEIRELRNRNIKFNKDNRPNLFYSFWLNPKKQDKDGFYEISIEKKNGWIEVAPAKSQGVQTVWRWGKPKSEENLNINIVGKDNQNGGYQIVEKYREKTRLARSVWWDKEVNSERGTLHLKNLFKGKIFDFPKPEELIKRVIEIGTQKGDLVLDFHLGSGTTASVAHKMERRYIGVEQMDYIENIPVKRLIKVIEGEDGGVSKAVKWEGGGSFVYAELLKNNQKFIEEIEKVKSDKDIKKIYKEMQGEAFFRYDIDIQKLKDKSTEKSFDELDLNSKKNILLDCLDANHLYVNYSDIEDNTFKVDKKDVVLNKKFYE